MKALRIISHAPVLLLEPALFVVGLPLFMVQYPWGCSSLPRVTPPLQRELLRLIPKSCPSPRDAIEHPRDTEDARVQFSPARTTAMTLKQQLEYYAYTYTYAYPSSAASTNDGGFDRAVMLCPAARSPRLPY